MERKIGEIFKDKGEWYQCVEGTGCYQCAFNQDEVTCLADNPHCTSRSDGKDVVFKRLEKVGKPYRRWLSPINYIMVQRYRLYGRNVIMPDEPYMKFNAIDNTIEIKLKQNKEDMEEKKLSLKPFDIQKARAGKPVCTRDGRKARIICFDANSPRPIIALVNTTGEDGRESELIETYYNSGKHYDGGDYYTDLMMLTEKRLAWVNVYRDEDGHLKVWNIYDTREEAEMQRHKDDYIATAEVSWEEEP